jgi:hypothetical protein
MAVTNRFSHIPLVRSIELICLNLDERRGTVEPERFGCLIEDYGTVLSGSAADRNTFDEPEKVTPRAVGVSVTDGRLSVSCEPGSLTVVRGEI